MAKLRFIKSFGQCPSAGKGHYLYFNLGSLTQEPSKCWEDATRALGVKWRTGGGLRRKGKRKSAERESKALPTVNKHKLRYINGKLRNKKGTMNFFLIDQR